MFPLLAHLWNYILSYGFILDLSRYISKLRSLCWTFSSTCSLEVGNRPAPPTNERPEQFGINQIQRSEGVFFLTLLLHMSFCRPAFGCHMVGLEQQTLLEICDPQHDQEHSRGLFIPQETCCFLPFLSWLCLVQGQGFNWRVCTNRTDLLAVRCVLHLLSIIWISFWM